MQVRSRLNGEMADPWHTRGQGSIPRMYHGGGRAGVDFTGTEGRVVVDRGRLEAEPAALKDTPTRASDVRL